MIKIELETWEALAILDPIQHGALEEQERAARLSGEDAEYASIRAQVRQRIATRIVDALFPEPTRIDRIGRDEFAAEVEMGLV